LGKHGETLTNHAGWVFRYFFQTKSRTLHHFNES